MEVEMYDEFGNYDRVSETETRLLRGLLEDLLELESGLSEWEVEFLEGMAKWEGCYFAKQAKSIAKIWDKYLGDTNTHN